MKILSTNRYTMAPGGVPVNRGNRLPPEGVSLYHQTKKRAKVLLFFDMTKKICTFLQKKCNLASIPYNFRACVRVKKAYAEMDTLNPLSMSGAAIASICSREILDRCSSGVLRSMT